VHKYRTTQETPHAYHQDLAASLLYSNRPPAHGGCVSLPRAKRCCILQRLQHMADQEGLQGSVDGGVCQLFLCVSLLVCVRGAPPSLRLADIA